MAKSSLVFFAVALATGCTAKDNTETVETAAKAPPKGAEAAPAKGSAGAPPKANAGDIPAPADVAAPPEDAKTTDSGLAYKVLEPGKGERRPRAVDEVEVHYTGWTTDGKMFDSSVKRGQTARFPLNGVIRGWTEGLQLMVEGEKTRFWIPEELAYKGAPSRPQGMLVFDVKLERIHPAPEDIPAPSDVAGPPDDAEKTASGLAYKIIKEGSGPNPKASSRVKVHYTGWTTDGKMFDSSVQRGQPAVFPLGGVIPGWTEGVQLIKKGGAARLWIPEELAYKGARGAPQGTLVFDVELIDILP